MRHRRKTKVETLFVSGTRATSYASASTSAVSGQVCRELMGKRVPASTTPGEMHSAYAVANEHRVRETSQDANERAPQEVDVSAISIEALVHRDQVE